MIEAVPDPKRSLLLRAASGEPAAARELLDATSATVYGFIYARVGGIRDIAEDLTQATYLQAMRSASTYRGEAALETWLCSIARRQVAQHYEGERRRVRLERKLRLVADEQGPEEEPEEAPVAPDVMIAALGRLMPLHRQVLVLKYLDCLSVDQICEVLERPRVQIQSLLQRARAGLRRELEVQADE